MKEIKISSGLAISDNGFLFNSSTGETFTTNPIAVKLLNQIKSGKNVSEIKEIILEEYDVDEDRFEKDLNEFILQLKNFGLLSDFESSGQ